MAEWTSWTETPPDADALVEWIRHKEGFDAYVHKGLAREVAAMLKAHRADPAAIFWRPARDNVVHLKTLSAP
jgi:hypothetical protein